MFYCAQLETESLIFAAGMLLDSARQQIFPAAWLLFSPVRVILLVVWVYFCVYSVLRVEGSNLIPVRHKAKANILALLTGPFFLFVLFVADVTIKLQEGIIRPGNILKGIFGDTFKRRRARYKAEKGIELLDSAGRSFAEVYSSQGRDQKTTSEILSLTESIILDGIRDRASDILLDPKSRSVFTVRFRIDGVLSTVSQMEADKAGTIVNSIKAISNMDIAERRRPQDGSFMARIPEGDVYFRVASAGVLGGEKLSIRILNQSAGLLRLDEIGLSAQSQRLVLDNISRASGMIVVCGPTGSGKTTSLYAMLSEVDFYERNVVTVEDPIEYVLPSASQIEVNVKANITFANALRNILRQDPDVICVGEIRDVETADMALQASQTGHLVLATLHSSSNLAALVRLMDLGVRPLLLASGLDVIISQRLVRRLCEHCKRPAGLTETQIANFERKKIDYRTIMEANGCKRCRGTGFVGRTAIMDVMRLDEDVKANLANERLSLGSMKQRGDKESMSALRKEGLRKVLAGITTIEEVQRVTSKLG
ncbi:MAG TPA: type II/IV secretion system protein [Planctomycetes bacterium]|nr:type II/IV secretion system protein [Planctomycetota bacterium]